LPKANEFHHRPRIASLERYPPLARAPRAKVKPPENGEPDEQFYNENRAAVETLLRAMSKAGDHFGGILAGIGNRFLETPHTERGSDFSTATAQTDFLDSLPPRHISRRSDFKLAALHGERPTTLYLCLPVRRMESHYRWLRLRQARVGRRVVGAWGSFARLSCIMNRRHDEPGSARPYPHGKPWSRQERTNLMGLWQT
jgi:hypothetical protein